MSTREHRPAEEVLSSSSSTASSCHDDEDVASDLDAKKGLDGEHAERALEEERRRRMDCEALVRSLEGEVAILTRRLQAREAAHGAEVRFVRGELSAARRDLGVAQGERDSALSMLAESELRSAPNNDRDVVSLERSQLESQSHRRNIEARDAGQAAELQFARKRHNVKLEERPSNEHDPRRRPNEERDSSKRIEANVTALTKQAAKDARTIDKLRGEATKLKAEKRSAEAELNVQRAAARQLQDRLNEVLEARTKHKKPSTALSHFLDRNGLLRFVDNFTSHGIYDVADLELLEESHWRELQLPLGPLRKLQVALRTGDNQSATSNCSQQQHQHKRMPTKKHQCKQAAAQCASR